MIYADTSLLLPIYTPEERSDEANRAIEGATALQISDLTVAEFIVGLARKVKLGTLPQPHADEVLTLFEQHIAEGFLHRVALMGEHYEAAGQVAFRSPLLLRTLDALHLAVALGLDATMATFDGRLSDAARAMGLEVIP